MLNIVFLLVLFPLATACSYLYAEYCFLTCALLLCGVGVVGFLDQSSITGPTVDFDCLYSTCYFPGCYEPGYGAISCGPPG